MANWSKVYESDLKDPVFQMLVAANPAIIGTWFWIFTECTGDKSAVIKFGFLPDDYSKIASLINQPPSLVDDAIQALAKCKFIKTNLKSRFIELVDWEFRVSSTTKYQLSKGYLSVNSKKGHSLNKTECHHRLMKHNINRGKTWTPRQVLEAAENVV